MNFSTIYFFHETIEKSILKAKDNSGSGGVNNSLTSPLRTLTIWSKNSDRLTGLVLVNYGSMLALQRAREVRSRKEMRDKVGDARGEMSTCYCIGIDQLEWTAFNHLDGNSWSFPVWEVGMHMGEELGERADYFFGKSGWESLIGESEYHIE